MTDALDYYGTWKLLDGLLDAVFSGVHREYALGNTAQQRTSKPAQTMAQSSSSPPDKKFEMEG